MAIPLKPDDVPKELQCSICFSVPLDPRILGPCSHVFCKDCIHQSISHRQNCPVCRRDCKPEQVLLLKNESSLSNRIWCNIPVKCKHHGNGCTWTGSMSDYRSHEQSCPGDKMLRKVRDLEETIKNLLTSHEETIDELRTANEDMRKKVSRMATEKQKVEKRHREDSSLIKRENKKLKGEKQWFRKRFSELSSSNELLQKKVEEDEKKIHDLTSKISCLESSVSSLEHEKKAITKDYPRLKRENRKVKRENNRLVKDMETMIADATRIVSAHKNSEDAVIV